MEAGGWRGAGLSWRGLTGRLHLDPELGPLLRQVGAGGGGAG